ncbi:MAG: hypothetical protein M1815_001342 [Lichina confinis]|nr:MAG: hypothetical protein M1815_001342 [Lichina confinis]
MATPTSPTNLGFDIDKTAPQLDPPKDDPIDSAYLAKCDGTNTENPVYIAIKGQVYDVTGKDAYLPGGAYHVFAGKDASRALAKSSTKAEDVKPEWEDLPEKEKKVLEEWVTFFTRRYNKVGRVSS